MEELKKRRFVVKKYKRQLKETEEFKKQLFKKLLKKVLERQKSLNKLLKESKKQRLERKEG